jgi:phage-related protein
MAARTLEVVIKGKDEASGVFKKVGSSAGGLTKALKGMVTVAGGMLMAKGIEAAAGAIGDLVSEVPRVSAMRDTFDKLARTIGTDGVTAMDQLRKATKGMVADSDLLEAGNKFLAMGLADTGDEAAKLAEIATQLGMAMGEDAAGSMENFALMLANQSIPRLDSFGISSGKVRDRIQELMESTEGLTREQAFMQAVMEEAEVTMGKVGVQGDNMAGNMARMQASFDNAKIAIGEAFMPILSQLMGALAQLAAEYLPLLVAAFQEKVVPFLQDVVIPVLGKLVNWLANVLPVAIQVIATIFETVWLPILQAVVSWVQENWPLLEAIFMAVFEAIQLFIEEDLPPIIDFLKGIFQGVIDWVKDNWPAISRVIGEVLGAVGSVISSILGEVIPFARDLLAGLVSWVQDNWPTIQSTIEGVMSTIQTVIETALGVIKGFWDTYGGEILTIVETVWNNIQTSIETIIGIIQGIITTIMSAIKGDWSTAWEGIKTITSNLWTGIRTVVSSAITIMKNVISIGLGVIKTVFGTIWREVRGVVAEKLIQIRDTIWNMIRKFPDIIKGFAHLFADAGRRLIDALGNAMKDKIDDVKNWVKDKLKALRDLFPFSEPKDPTSPLRGLSAAGESIGKSLLDGLRMSMPAVATELQTQLAGVNAAMTRTLNTNVYHGDRQMTYNINDQQAMAMLMDRERVEERSRLSRTM